MLIRKLSCQVHVSDHTIAEFPQFTLELSCMEAMKNFLESSSIHGLTHISSSRNGKYARLFWIAIVISGFTGAGIIIYQSFHAWHEDPVKTTEDTIPINEIPFPKVMVCPPKHTYTDLNFDLLNTENMTIDNKTRNELISYSLELLYDHLHNNMMRNLSNLEDKERYYNWYHGYTRIILPSYTNTFRYEVYTSATSGHISTQYFGDDFDVLKVGRNLKYSINIKPPPSTINSLSQSNYNMFSNSYMFEDYEDDSNDEDEVNVALHFDIVKISMKDLSGEDIFKVDDNYYPTSDEKQVTYNITSLGDRFVTIMLTRDVTLEDVKKQRLDVMPGFRINWHYSGMEVEAWSEFDGDDSISFVRNSSIKIIYHSMPFQFRI